MVMSKSILGWVAVAGSLLWSQQVQGTSNGLDVFICDPRSKLYGCDPSRFKDGDRLKCLDSDTHEMHWATAPKRSSIYTISAETNTYTPLRLMRIKINVNQGGKQFRGIMMQARDSRDNVVGDWEIPNIQPAMTHASLAGQKCKQTLFHANADLKPYETTYQFLAPARGTGRITIFTLIKTGDANEGAMWYPETDLVLNEGGPTQYPVQWIRSALGQSCDETCGQFQGTCDSIAMSQANSPANMEKFVAQDIACPLPYVSQCSNLGPTTGSDGICYYHDPSACLSRQLQAVACSSKSSDELVGNRLCPCAGILKITSSANRGSSPIGISAMLVALFAHQRGGGSFSSTLVIIMAMLLSMTLSVNGHNWIQSFSRSPRASTTFPCKARVGNTPHVQVGVGQDFEIEWVTGHTSPGYFVIVRAEDESKLARLDRNALEKYFAECPNNAQFQSEANGKYAKIRRKNEAGTVLTTNDGPVANFFEKELKSGDPDFSVRHPELVEQGKGDINGPRFKDDENLFVARYKSFHKSSDKRCKYTNKDMPFIIEASKFDYVTEVPRGSVDSARFRIGRQGQNDIGPGEYIVWWNWRAYYDCIDVQVVNQAVPEAQIYGVSAGGAADNLQRVDHCEFRAKAAQNKVCAEIVDDLAACTALCGSNCAGVQVTPLQVPDTVPPPLREYREVRFSFDNNDVIEDGKVVPYCKAKVFANYSPQQKKNTLVCIPIIAADLSETQDAFVTTSDASDPVYYKTCFVKQLARTFAGVTQGEASEQEKKNDWFTSGGNSCLSCEDTGLFRALDFAIPLWSPISGNNVCINCDLEPKRFSASALDAAAKTKPVSSFASARRVPKALNELPWKNLGNNNQLCATGLHTCTQSSGQAEADDHCIQVVRSRGSILQNGASHPMEAETCMKLAFDDPQCDLSKVFYNINQKQCRCQKKKSCCKTCNLATADNGFRMFDASQVTNTGTNQLHVFD